LFPTITVYTLQVPKYVRNRLTRIVCLEQNMCTIYVVLVIHGKKTNIGTKVQSRIEINGIIKRHVCEKQSKNNQHHRLSNYEKRNQPQIIPT
jgi:hypothetical protein